MNCIYLFGPRVIRKISCYRVVVRKLSDGCFRGDKRDNGYEFVEETLKTMWDSFAV